MKGKQPYGMVEPSGLKEAHQSLDRTQQLGRDDRQVEGKGWGTEVGEGAGGLG